MRRFLLAKGHQIAFAPDAVAARQWLALRQGWREPNHSNLTADDIIRFAEMARAEAARRGIDYRTAIEQNATAGIGPSGVVR